MKIKQFVINLFKSASRLLRVTKIAYEIVCLTFLADFKLQKYFSCCWDFEAYFKAKWFCYYTATLLHLKEILVCAHRLIRNYFGRGSSCRNKTAWSSFR